MTGRRARAVGSLGLAGVLLLAGLGASGAHAAGPAPFSQVFTVLSQSPDGTSDLDGDALADVVVDEDLPTNQAFFRRGTDGALLWSLPQTYDAFIGVMRLGSPARPGVLSAHYDDNSGDLLRALDGATGRYLWSSTVLRSEGHPSFYSYLPGRVGQATRLLLRRPGKNNLGSVPVVVSGRDGTWWTAGIAGQTIDAVSDVDGDGYADIGVRTGNTLELRSSTTGQTLWRKAFVPYTTFRSVPIPDVTGDQHPDVLIHDESQVTAINGRSGAQVWHAKSGGNLDPIGDVNSDGTTDFLGAAITGTCTRTATAYSGVTGGVLWQKVATSTQSPCDPPLPNLAGDVNADHVTDLYLADASFAPGATTGIIDGRTGTWLWHGSFPSRHFGEVALNASIDGNGDDLTADNWPVYMPLTVYDGRTNAASFSLPTRDRVLHPAQAGQLTADTKPDLVLATFPYTNDPQRSWTGRPVQVEVIDGATHAVRWAIDVN